MAARPSSSGISTSMVMMSGLRSRASSTASRPLRASPTTVISPSVSMMRRRTMRMKVELSTTRTRRRGADGLAGAVMPPLRRDISAAVDRISSGRPFALPRPAMRGSWSPVGRMSSRAIVTMRWTPLTERTRRSPSCCRTMNAAAAPPSPSDSHRQPSVTGMIRPPNSIAPSMPGGAPAGRRIGGRGGRMRSIAARARAKDRSPSDTQRNRCRSVAATGAAAVPDISAVKSQPSRRDERRRIESSGIGPVRRLIHAGRGQALQSADRIDGEDEPALADRHDDMAGRRRSGFAAEQPGEREDQHRLAAQDCDTRQERRRQRQPGDHRILEQLDDRYRRQAIGAAGGVDREHHLARRYGGVYRRRAAVGDRSGRAARRQEGLKVGEAETLRARGKSPGGRASPPRLRRTRRRRRTARDRHATQSADRKRGRPGTARRIARRCGRAAASRMRRASTGMMSPEMLATPSTPAGAKGRAVTAVAGSTRSTQPIGQGEDLAVELEPRPRQALRRRRRTRRVEAGHRGQARLR